MKETEAIIDITPDEFDDLEKGYCESCDAVRDQVGEDENGHFFCIDCSDAEDEADFEDCGKS